MGGLLNGGPPALSHDGHCCSSMAVAPFGEENSRLEAVCDAQRISSPTDFTYHNMSLGSCPLAWNPFWDQDFTDCTVWVLQ